MRNLEPKFQREKNMADDKTTNGELCDDDELKADEYKLQANQFFKGRGLYKLYLSWLRSQTFRGNVEVRRPIETV